MDSRLIVQKLNHGEGSLQMVSRKWQKSPSLWASRLLNESPTYCGVSYKAVMLVVMQYPKSKEEREAPYPRLGWEKALELPDIESQE